MLSTPRTIESPRLRLRVIAEDDLAPLMAVNGDEVVTHYLPFRPWQAMSDACQWFEHVVTLQDAGEAVQFVLAHRVSDKAIGTCILFGIDAANKRAELAFALGRAYWGRGLMTEALVPLIDDVFARMGLRRLEACGDPRNQLSSRVLLRLGFTREGLCRERWLVDGKGVDSEVFGLLSSEWPARRRFLPSVWLPREVRNARTVLH